MRCYRTGSCAIGPCPVRIECATPRLIHANWPIGCCRVTKVSHQPVRRVVIVLRRYHTNQSDRPAWLERATSTPARTCLMRGAVLCGGAFAAHYNPLPRLLTIARNRITRCTPISINFSSCKVPRCQGIGVVEIAPASTTYLCKCRLIEFTFFAG